MQAWRNVEISRNITPGIHACHFSPVRIRTIKQGDLSVRIADKSARTLLMTTIIDRVTCYFPSVIEAHGKCVDVDVGVGIKDGESLGTCIGGIGHCQDKEVSKYP